MIRFVTIVITLFVFGSTAGATQQNRFANIIIIEESSATLSQWFNLIQSHGVVLSYSTTKLDMEKKISVKAGKIKIEDLVKKLLSGYDFKLFPVENNKLIIQINGIKRIFVTGFIKEKNSGEALNGASIRFKERNGKEHYTLSDSEGHYNISLLEGMYTVDVNYLGYEPLHGSVHLTQTSHINYSLSPSSFALEEIVISPRIDIGDFNDISPSNMLSFSNSDVFSQIRILPGIIGSPANGNLQVNGGGGDENLILLDGVPIYHTNHLNSMLPVFNGDAVKNVVFHKSFFPALYEGRLSSITDIQLKDGDKENYKQTLSLEMPAASVVSEGPIVKNKVSYIVAARRSWLDFFNNLLSESAELNHSFYDINAKISYDVNKRFSLKSGYYRTADHYYAPGEYSKRESVSNWNTNAYYFKTSALIGKVLQTNTLAYTKYSNMVNGSAIGLLSQKNIISRINMLSFSSNYNFDIDNTINISCGIKVSNEHFDLAYGLDTVRTEKENVTQYSFFYTTKIRITDELQAQAGVNFVAYLPRADKNYHSIQPRFSLKYSPSSQHLVCADFSRMEQFYHYIRIEEIPLPTDFRMPSVNGFKPSIAEHYEVRWKYLTKHNSFESSLYYKRRHNVIAFRPGEYPKNEEWNKYIMSGNGESYGFLFNYFGNWKKLMMQFSYSFSRSKEWFNEYNNSEKIPSLYDVPHICNLALTYRINASSGVSLGGNIRSGRISGPWSDDQSQSDYKFRGHRKKPNYRVDASYYYSKDINDSKYKLFLRLGLYNIVGNPTVEDNLDFFSIRINNHCLPYISITFKF